jgi:hypothetical protein
MLLLKRLWNASKGALSVQPHLQSETIPAEAKSSLTVSDQASAIFRQAQRMARIRSSG